MIPDGQEVMIKLLGRIAFKPDEIAKIVTFKKGASASRYLAGYNACDGNRSLKDIASIIRVTSSTLSPILKQWEDEGIVFKTEGEKYKKLFPLDVRRNG